MSAGPPGSLRVLIVDDDVVASRALAKLLRHQGHNVTTAHTLAGALALGTHGAAPDLLVCDVDLPDGDGCELLRRLRAFYGGRHMAAVAVTGHGEEWAERCREAGYGWFLIKPLRFEKLLQVVAAVVAGGNGALKAATT